MILNVLKGLIFFLSASAIISLASAVVEARVQKHLTKDPEYILAISVLKPLCWGGLVVAIGLTMNYTWRLFTGLTGSLLPGPEVNTVISLLSLSVAFAFLTGLGVVLLWVLWQSYDPSEEELQRRRRIAEAQSRAEQSRQEGEGQR